MPSDVPTQSVQFKGYIAPIDGLRAIAILVVVLHHLLYPIWPNSLIWWGWSGVDLFFVISGFLITGILYDALHKSDFFRSFYIRRTLRIFPLYYAVWAVLVLFSFHYPVNWNRYFAYDALYLVNWFAPGSIMKAHADSLWVTFHRPGGRYLVVNTAHFWSLALEEQFYLVWPLVVWLARRRRSLMLICGLVIFFLPLLRLFMRLHLSPEAINAEVIVVSTYTRIDTLLIGGWCALWLRAEAAPTVAIVRRLSHFLIAVPLALLVLAQMTVGQRWTSSMASPVICIYGFTALALISAGLVLSCLYESLIAKVLLQRPLLHLGRISYGLYVFHYLLMLRIIDYEVLAQRRHLGFLVFLAACLCIYTAARLSYRFLELPFLRLKDVLTKHDHASAPLRVPHAI